MNAGKKAGRSWGKSKKIGPHAVTSSWDGFHGLYVFTFREGKEKRKLFIAEEMVYLMFDGQPEQPEGYTLAELVELGEEEAAA
jgi:hypothetical protein